VALRDPIEQRFGVFKVRRIKPLGKPVVDLCQQLVGFGLLALLLPQASEAGSSAKLPRFRFLLAGNLNGLVKTLLRFFLYS